MEQSVPWDGRLHFNLSRNRQSCPFRPWWGAGPASLCPGYPGQEDGLRELEAGSSDRWLCRGESLASVICVVRRAMVTFQSLHPAPLLGVSGLRTVLLLTGRREGVGKAAKRRPREFVALWVQRGGPGWLPGFLLHMLSHRARPWGRPDGPTQKARPSSQPLGSYTVALSRGSEMPMLSVWAGGGSCPLPLPPLEPAPAAQAHLISRMPRLQVIVSLLG